MTMRALVGLMIGALLALSSIHQTAQAQSSGPARPPSIMAQRPAAPSTQPGVIDRFYQWVVTRQGEYNRKLARTLREIKTGEPLTAAILLAALSFAYGILHAAGPGHGKAIISSYVLANERTVRRGIALSFLAAFFQALSAIILVGVLVMAFRASGLARKATEDWLETISWGIVAGLGAVLLWQQLRKAHAHWRESRLLAVPAGAPVAHSHGHSHDPAHAHGAACCAHHEHEHAHDHGHHDACCGHAHMPDPRQLESGWSWPRALAISMAVGLRPCTGAVFILGFALSQGLLWAGIFATFAMALGTAITVSFLAAVAVGSRELAARLSGGEVSPWATRVRLAAGIGGSLAVLVLGIVLFLGSLSPQSFV
ncbi:MAG: nickel/cobalt transporter [Hyphomicrobiaceae bacterium]